MNLDFPQRFRVAADIASGNNYMGVLPNFQNVNINSRGDHGVVFGHYVLGGPGVPGLPVAPCLPLFSACVLRISCGVHACICAVSQSSLQLAVLIVYI